MCLDVYEADTVGFLALQQLCVCGRHRRAPYTIYTNFVCMADTEGLLVLQQLCLVLANPRVPSVVQYLVCRLCRLPRISNIIAFDTHRNCYITPSDRRSHLPGRVSHCLGRQQETENGREVWSELTSNRTPVLCGTEQLLYLTCVGLGRRQETEDGREVWFRADQ
ncbi:hypothetical protein J6590_036884 [Homalodisca vitripennis]|nr:hypothetical protein J6590_036884 [Homalodisca vitripennis]